MKKNDSLLNQGITDLTLDEMRNINGGNEVIRGLYWFNISVFRWAGKVLDEYARQVEEREHDVNHPRA